MPSGWVGLKAVFPPLPPFCGEGDKIRIPALGMTVDLAIIWV